MITRFSTCADGPEPSERDLSESDDAGLGHARVDSVSAGHEALPPMMLPPGVAADADAAAAGGGAGTLHAVFLATALAGSAPSAWAGGSRRAGARLGSGADCAGAAPPAAGDIWRRGDGDSG